MRVAARLIGYFCLTGLWLPFVATAFIAGPSFEGPPLELEQRIFRMVNDHRRSIGRKDLVWNEGIAAEARAHSADMAEGRVGFGHDGFNDRVGRLQNVLPWQAAAEVVAFSGNAEGAFDGWLKSAEHRPCIEGDFDLSGVGVVQTRSGQSYYFTGILLKSRRRPPRDPQTTSGTHGDRRSNGPTSPALANERRKTL
jgi:uncharacterized protein YkwD